MKMRIMKKHMAKRSVFCLLLLGLTALCACALAAPEVTSLLASDAALISGQDGWYFDFNVTEGGTLGAQLFSGETGEFVAPVGAQ